MTRDPNEFYMVEVGGVWMPAPPPAIRRALLDEASAECDRVMRRTLWSPILGLLLTGTAWGLVPVVATSSTGDAALLVLFAAEAIPRIFGREAPALLEVRDRLARARGFVIPGRPWEE